MNSIPLLEENQDEIRQSLSLEEIRIALSFLKKRFRDYTLKEIVQALNEYVLQKEASALSVPINCGSTLSVPRIPEGLFLHHRYKPMVHQDRSTKSEEIRLVAKLYCQSGIKYSLAQYFYPQMTQKDYKSELELITAQTLNCIQKFLRYECNVQIQQLSRLQKRSIRQKMINIRQWMGKTHPEHMQTYFMFIERNYLNQNIEIEYKQALELYKIILQSVKGPQVEVNQTNEVTNRSLRQQLRLNEREQKTCTKDEENALILLFKQLNSIQKVSDAMCQKYGYDIKWSIHSIKNILKRIYKSALKKLCETAEAYLRKPANLWFSYGDEDVHSLMQNQNSLPVKIVLLDFYLLKKTSELKLRQFVRKVNDFYVKQYQPNQAIEAIPSDPVRIPTLVIDDERPRQAIEINEQISNDPTKRQVKVNNHLKSKKSKKKDWRQFILVQSDEEQIFIFPQNDSILMEKQIQYETDAQNVIPIRKREKQIFKPTLKQPKQDEKKMKDQMETKDIKDNKIKSKDIQVKQQESLQQNPPKSKQLLVQKQKTSRISKINQSIDSIQSEPARLNLYNNSSIRNKKFNSNNGHRFKKKAIDEKGDRMDLQN